MKRYLFFLVVMSILFIIFACSPYQEEYYDDYDRYPSSNTEDPPEEVAQKVPIDSLYRRTQFTFNSDILKGVIRGDYLYITRGGCGIEIYKKNNEDYIPVSLLQTEGMVRDIILDGDYLILNEGNHGISCYNISLPIEPLLTLPGVFSDGVVTNWILGDRSLFILMETSWTNYVFSIKRSDLFYFGNPLRSAQVISETVSKYSSFCLLDKYLYYDSWEDDPPLYVDEDEDLLNSVIPDSILYYSEWDAVDKNKQYQPRGRREILDVWGNEDAFFVLNDSEIIRYDWITGKETIQKLDFRSYQAKIMGYGKNLMVCNSYSFRSGDLFVLSSEFPSSVISLEQHENFSIRNILVDHFIWIETSEELFVYNWDGSLDMKSAIEKPVGVVVFGDNVFAPVLSSHLKSSLPYQLYNRYIPSLVIPDEGLLLSHYFYHKNTLLYGHNDSLFFSYWNRSSQELDFVEIDYECNKSFEKLIIIGDDIFILTQRGFVYRFDSSVLYQISVPFEAGELIAAGDKLIIKEKNKTAFAVYEK